MIRFQSTRDGMPDVVMELRGVGVYLDNWAIIDLANGPGERKERFVTSLKKCGSLLFSFTNAIELSQAENPSAAKISGFLDSIGSHWIPLEMNPWTVATRERSGQVEPTPCISEVFVKAYVQDRLYELSPGGSSVVDLSADTFFALSSAMRWSQEQKVATLKSTEEIDEALIGQVKAASEKFKADPNAVDALFPSITYDEKAPAMFALQNLLRGLVKNAKVQTLKKGDGRDLCHAVLGTAYATFATLDKQWKKRVEALPKPNGLAPVYYAPELDKLVADLEAAASAWD